MTRDIPREPEWSTAGLTEAELLSSSGDTLDDYELLDLPRWTLSADRYWFLRGHVEQTGGSATFWWERLTEGGAHRERWEQVRAAHPRAIEPPVNVGGWVFTQTGVGTAVECTLCTDTGGPIPSAV